MQPGDPVVVAVEEGEEILGQVVLVALVERAHDAEVDRAVLRVFRVLELHEDVARVHVGVEEVVPQHLREEDRHAVFREALDVGAAPAQLVHVADDDAVDAFHHHHFRAAVVPVHLRHVEQVGTGEIALQLRGVRRLAHQVELVDHGLLVLAHHLDRPQPVALARVVAREAGQHVHHLEVALDPLAHAGAHDLGHDVLAGAQPGDVHLRDRRRRERRLVELLEHLGDRPSVGALDDRAGLGARERRHAVLQLLELVGDVGRQQVAARRQRLAELHEDRPEFLEREPDALAARAALAALEPRGRRQVEREAQRTEQVRGEDDLVEPVAHEHALDLQEPADDAESHGGSGSADADVIGVSR